MTKPETLIPVTNNRASAAFAALCQIFEARVNELAEYAKLPLSADTDEELDFKSPILVIFLQSNGTASIMKMTTFTVSEIRNFLQNSKQFLSELWKTGRRKSFLCHH